jgi:hypothetical protein
MSVGDRVTIKTAPWKGEQGIVESIDGANHIVRRDGCFHPDDVIELYPNEIKAIAS